MTSSHRFRIPLVAAVLTYPLSRFGRQPAAPPGRLRNAFLTTQYRLPLLHLLWINHSLLFCICLSVSFTILIACRRNPTDRAGLDKALIGENFDYKCVFFCLLIFYIFSNQDMLGLLLYVLYLSLCLSIYLAIPPSLPPSIYLSIYLPIYLSS